MKITKLAKTGIDQRVAELLGSPTNGPTDDPAATAAQNSTWKSLVPVFLENSTPHFIEWEGRKFPVDELIGNFRVLGGQSGRMVLRDASRSHEWNYVRVVENGGTSRAEQKILLFVPDEVRT